tara:strand:+ start:78 stop:512 length:435 start_codon:yes stop_codon:yes gene_type:complete
MKIKTFRGLLADGGQDTIRLSTRNGLTGYKINRFEAMGKTPGASNQESVIKIFKVKQDSVDGVIDFNDSRLMAAAITTTSVDQEDFPLSNAVIFDNEIINQDIFITHFDVKTGESANYYLELEQVKLDINEAAVATLKDMRGRE